MKVLSVVWKIYDDRLQGFCNDTNGLIVIRDLCEYLGRKIESYLLLGKEYLPSMELGHIHIVDSESMAQYSAGASHLEIVKRAFEKALIDIEPDIVHIHDSGDFCRACIDVCVEKKVPYVFTAHAFIGKNQRISKINDRDIIWQEEVYTKPDVHIVAVGKGLANKIRIDYPDLREEQLRIIQNGTDFKARAICSNLKEELQLQGKKLLVCPGKITYRKNQIQIVRAFALLPKAITEHLGVLFCGNDRLDGELQRAINHTRLGGSLKYIGVLNSKQMQEVYSICDGLIMASITEGLSIAALEALAYGLPLIMFADVECAADLGDERISCLAKERTDHSLAQAIKQWADTTWDRNDILKSSEQFSMDRVADSYIQYYCDILHKGINVYLG